MSPKRVTRGLRGALLTGLVLLPGCLGDPPPPPVDLDAPLRTELGIDPGVPIHRITLGGRGSQDHVVPLRVEGSPGDVLHVLSGDRRIQTFSFVDAGLSPEALEFLERTGQMGSPPLTDVGSAWILSFEGAPEGEYPFVVRGHGEPVQGMVDIRRRR